MTNSVFPCCWTRAGWGWYQPFVQHQLYHNYGSTVVMAPAYAATKTYVELLRANAGDNILTNGLGDWSTLETKSLSNTATGLSCLEVQPSHSDRQCGSPVLTLPPPPLPRFRPTFVVAGAPVGTAPGFYYSSASILSEIAGILGNTADAAHYAQLGRANGCWSPRGLAVFGTKARLPLTTCHVCFCLRG